MTDPREELRRLGAELGGLDWVQGPGGNVSVKTEEGELWVKASGTRLTEVATDAGHVRVGLALAERALGGDETADAELFARKPRPSLETYFHALPGRVVAHVHALGVLLYACSTASAPPKIAARVGEIPYVRPGRGVALAIRDALDAMATEQVVVLRSHGIVAYADSAARAVVLLRDIDAACRTRLDGAPLPAFEEFLAPYLAGARRDLAGGAVQAIPPRVAPEVPRYLFPDAVVCASTVLVDTLTDVEAVASHALKATGRAGVLVDSKGARAVFGKNPAQLKQSIEVLAAHDWIEDALAPRGLARYLPDDEPAKILDMPSEQYRIRLAAGASATREAKD